jgi:(p)ppGpp synthase/HD superfamily hydrolase
MLFAQYVHRDQVRKYTGEPYFKHLAEVAAIVQSVGLEEKYISMAWLHDSMEDQEVPFDLLEELFSFEIADGVSWLTDKEEGNRAERVAASIKRLAKAPRNIQTIKLADLISNTGSIVTHDPNFAVTYLKEKRALLDVMNTGNPILYRLAVQSIADGWKKLGISPQ